MRKGVYADGYMNDWEKFIETLLPEKEDFYSNPNMEGINDGTSGAWEEFEKTLKWKTKVITLICMFKVINICQLIYLKIFWNICHKIQELDPACFIRFAALKNIKVELELLTEIAMSLMIEKAI